MYIRVNKTPNSPRQSVQIVESKRDGNKVRQTILRHVGIALDDVELEKLKDLAAEIIVKLEAERNKQLEFWNTAPSNTKRGRGRPKKKSLEEVLPASQASLSELREKQRINEGFTEIYGALFDELGFDGLLRRTGAARLLKDIVLARIAHPSSKRRACRMFET